MMPKAFLITFKPASENPERGWPLTELQRLVRQLKNGDVVEENWRFRNRKDVADGDRIFLLLQGKQGPAIIGYGRVNGDPKEYAGKDGLPIKFERLVDPSLEYLTGKAELVAIRGGQGHWRTQSSGVKLKSNVAEWPDGFFVPAS